MTYSQLCYSLQELMDVKERTAKSYIQYMKEKGIICKDPVKDTFFILNAH